MDGIIVPMPFSTEQNTVAQQQTRRVHLQRTQMHGSRLSNKRVISVSRCGKVEHEFINIYAEELIEWGTREQDQVKEIMFL
mmetsp:Transcript_3243/g.6730  ORF Transcript_3243/g.6730 Transcript_3243/m.6730 type:complete len:81 (+) Transcript_3243:1617-1859(+)